jgi:hypothetical protein
MVSIVLIFVLYHRHLIAFIRKLRLLRSFFHTLPSMMYLTSTFNRQTYLLHPPPLSHSPTPCTPSFLLRSPSHCLSVSMRPLLSSASQHLDRSPPDFPTLAPRCNKYRHPRLKFLPSKNWAEFYSLTPPESVGFCDGCTKLFYHTTMGV